MKQITIDNRVHEFIDLLNQYEVDCNIGLSPNPNGFSYIGLMEIPVKYARKIQKLGSEIENNYELLSQFRFTYY